MHEIDASSNGTQTYKFAGIILIVEAIFSVITMLQHPEVTQSNAQSVISEIAGQANVARGVHGLMMVFIVLNFYALSSYAKLLKQRNCYPELGLVFYLFGAIAMLLAPIISGFVMTTLAERYAEFSPDSQTVFTDLSRMLAAGNQAFAMAGSVAYAITAVAWGLMQARGKGISRTVGIVGIVVGFLIIAGLLLGMRLDVHGMTAVVLGLSLWYCAIAFDLIRTSQAQKP